MVPPSPEGPLEGDDKYKECRGAHSPLVLGKACHLFYAMAYGTRRRYGRRRAYLKRRRYRRVGRLGLRRRRYGRRALYKRRGGPRVRRIRMPARNPFGDTLKIKFLRTFSVVLTADANGAAWYTNKLWWMGDSRVGTAPNYTWGVNPYGSCEGFRHWAELYEQYNVLGHSIAVTPFLAGDAADTPLAAAVLCEANDDNLKVKDVNTIPEMRYCRWRYLQNWNEGGRPITVRNYFSKKNILSGNTRNYIQTPAPYAITDTPGFGNTAIYDGVAGYIDGSVETAGTEYYTLGVFSVDPVNKLPEGTQIGATIKMVHYVQMTNRRRRMEP